MLSKKAKGLIKLGRETGKDDRKHLIRGRLIENITQGKDRGALSAKILGGDSEINMWQPEIMAGVIVLQPPPMSDEQRAGMLERPPDLESVDPDSQAP